MVIRSEEEKDIEVIYTVVKTAFAGAEHSDGNEHNLVNALRKGTGFVPELALVAEINDKIVGYIMFTKAEVGNRVELALAPLAVLPEYQRKGIGTVLIEEGHRIAQELGYEYSIVLGSEKYYPRTGYLPAHEFGIKAPFDVPSENFMVCRFKEDAPRIYGIVKYAKEFGMD